MEWDPKLVELCSSHDLAYVRLGYETLGARR